MAKNIVDDNTQKIERYELRELVREAILKKNEPDAEEISESVSIMYAYDLADMANEYLESGYRYDFDNSDFFVFN